MQFLGDLPVIAAAAILAGPTVARIYGKNSFWPFELHRTMQQSSLVQALVIVLAKNTGSDQLKNQGQPCFSSAPGWITNFIQRCGFSI